MEDKKDVTIPGYRELESSMQVGGCRVSGICTFCSGLDLSEPLWPAHGQTTLSWHFSSLLACLPTTPFLPPAQLFSQLCSPPVKLLTCQGLDAPFPFPLWTQHWLPSCSAPQNVSIWKAGVTVRARRITINIIATGCWRLLNHIDTTEKGIINTTISPLS